VGWVMFERAGTKATKSQDQKKITASGFTWGAINILSHSFAYITAKTALENVPSMEASLLRQGTAMLTLVVFCLIRRRLWNTLKPAFRRHNLRMLIGASTCGSFFGIWLGLLGIKLAPVSIASTLNTTTPLFILPINRIIEKQKITIHSILGALIAFSGAAILLISKA
jgi:drug/metabolite transporter (DMT)-like permease